MLFIQAFSIYVNTLTSISEIIKNKKNIRYFNNTLWMLSEYVLRIISAIFVSIYVARYLGPEQFGMISYALAIVSVFMAMSRLGMESILVRDLATYPEDAKAYMGTALSLMFIATISSLVVLTALIYFFESDAKLRVYIWIISTGIVFQSFLVIDYYFQAQVKAKYSSVAKSTALAISSIIKIYLVWIKSDILLFAIAYAFDYVIIGLALLATYYIKKLPNFIFAFHKSLIKPLLRSAWPMVMSALAFMLYARVDQLMIKYFLDSKQLGIYVAALRIFEGWTMFPFVLIISLLPALAKMRERSSSIFYKKVVYLFRFFIVLSITAAIFTSIFSKEIIIITYGKEFSDTASVLHILMWAAVFTTMGTITVRLLTIEKMEKKVFKITTIGLFVNVITNFLLIPRYGIDGAAYATLTSLFVVYYGYDYFDKDMKSILRAKNHAFLIGKV